MVYYNEIDKYAAQWLRNLMAAGLIPAGEVDERSIEDVKPADLGGFTSCHFFAGVSGWAYALRLAGWPDDQPVWTGSCPCQPLSSAGQRKGHADKRHLWPAFHALIAECRPAALFGEQVASADGREWLAGIRADLEAVGYAVGAADLCAASVGAPHPRQRLYWVADPSRQRRHGRQDATESQGRNGPQASRSARRLGHSDLSSEHERTSSREQSVCDERGSTSKLEHASSKRGGRHAGAVLSAEGESTEQRQAVGVEPHEPITASDAGALVDATSEQAGISRRARQPRGTDFWSDCEWLPCTDGKYRPVEPGTFPLAHGIPNRMGRLRGYGNAIVPQVAAEFIAAYLEARAAA